VDENDPNNYSPTWFETFLATVDPARTQAELDFLERCLPNPPYRSALDLGCGTGRIANPLAGLGYTVTGIDRSPQALAEARRGGSSARFIELDLRRLADLPGRFDAVISLWQSFGYFDAETNATILNTARDKLNPHGRLVLDVYHRDYFAARSLLEAQRSFVRGGRLVLETVRLDGNRLRVTLDYGPEVSPDVFYWQVYTPEELFSLLTPLHFRCTVACTGFDETRPPSPDSPRMQLVFQLEEAE
jgi:SAM-dependent methyltransferase